MAEAGAENKVKALRALFEKNASKPKSPEEFERTRASVVRHNLKFEARRASRIGQATRVQATESNNNNVVATNGFHLVQMRFGSRS